MKERKVQQNIRRHHVRQRRSRRWILKPVIIAELALVMLLAGVGMAFALTVNTVTPTAQPWAGTATIASASGYSITGYTLNYDSTFGYITGVTLSITNSSATTTASINIAALYANGSVVANNVTATHTYTTGSYPFVFNASVALANMNSFNVLLTEP